MDDRTARGADQSSGLSAFDLIRQRATEEAARKEQAAAEAKARRVEQIRQEMAEIEREIKKKGAVVEENEALWFYNNIRIKAKGDAAYREKMRLKKKEKGNV